MDEGRLVFREICIKKEGMRMKTDWSESYTGKLRALVGHQKLIIPSIRAAIYDDDGRMLYIKRRDSEKWALPAGAIELNESIFECLQREVRQEK
jgi:8-oxo-dGTP pyrophosphatase MutT (NUDIX family)